MAEKRTLDIVEKKGEQPDNPIEFKTLVKITDEGEDVEAAKLVPETPATFDVFMKQQALKFDPSLFRSQEEFELFCMLPTNDAGKQAILLKMAKETPGHKRRATTMR